MKALPLPLDQIAIAIGVSAGSVEKSHGPYVKAEIKRYIQRLCEQYRNTPVALLCSLSSSFELLAVEAAQELGTCTYLFVDPPALTTQHKSFERIFRTRLDVAIQRCSRIEMAHSTKNPNERSFQAKEIVASYSIYSLSYRLIGGDSSSPPESIEANTRYERVLSDLGAQSSIVLDCSNPDELPKAFNTNAFPRRFTTDDAFERDFKSALASIDAYNGDRRRLGHRTKVKSIADFQEQTTLIANNLQRTTFTYLYCLYFFAMAATIAQYALSPALKYPMILLAFFAYLIAKKHDYENRYQDYRVLSEALRVQVAWISGGVSNEVLDRAYLTMQERDIYWIRLSLRFVRLIFRVDFAEQTISGPVVRNWVKSQWEYFQDKPRAEEKILKRIRVLTRALLIFSISASTFLFIFLYLHSAVESLTTAFLHAANNGSAVMFRATDLKHFATTIKTGEAWIHSVLFSNSTFGREISMWDVSGHHEFLVKLSTALLTVYTALTLLISDYTKKRGFAINVKRYDRMFVVFDRAREMLEKLQYEDTAEMRSIITKLGREAVVENADWLLIRRDSPIKFINSA